ncbi:MAG: hypothetical protein V2J24_18500 [Pseudomonadales bacterium]|nr:hypothetical protein [Pseudomonadales bacterium]
MVLFLVGQTLVEAKDSLAWVLLLLLFEWETRRLAAKRLEARARQLLHAGRAFAYFVIVGAAIEYSSEAFRREWGDLDAWNAWTWIAVTVLLEAELWIPHRYGRMGWLLRNGAKTLLYGALVTYALRWGLEGQWLDGYDASLWILCFFVIELNVFDLEREAKTLEGSA